MYGPFKVTGKHSSSCVLQLPPDIDVHPTFHINLLRKNPNNPLPGQRNPEPPPVKIGKHDEWLVEHIVGSRRYRRRLEYRVKWMDHKHNPGWYPVEFFDHAQEKVQEFHAANRNAAGPPQPPPAPPAPMAPPPLPSRVPPPLPNGTPPPCQMGTPLLKLS